jgi:predicted DNA-binding transcriptional regulator YafY
MVQGLFTEGPAMSKTSRKGISRPPLERFVFIARLIRDKGAFRSSDVIEGLEVTRKTVARDIDFMRDRLGYEIEWMPCDRCYKGRMPEERIL